MSKLIDLISKLGQQSAQPIGFGALTGRVEATPTMALIGSTSVSELEAILGSGAPDGVDAILLSGDEVKSVLDLSKSGSINDLIWGLSAGSLNADDLDASIAAGCDFVLVEPDSPASVVGKPDLGTIVVTSGPVDRQTGVALRSLKVHGSLNTSDVGSNGLNFNSLVEIVKVGASVGGVMFLSVNKHTSTADLTAMRDAGVDGLVVPLGDIGLVEQIVESIRDIPARKRPEARGLSVTAPTGDS